MTTTAVLLTLLGLILGSMMFSYWIGRIIARRDIRELGDGNPGAFNLIKTGNIPAAALGVFLDMSKGVIPIGLAVYIFGLSGAQLIPIIAAPALGHAFSPFMRFKGGKAMAATGGAWIAFQPVLALTIGLAVFVGWSLILTVSGWAIVCFAVTMLIILLVVLPDPVVIVAWVLSCALLIYKYRGDLRQPIRVRESILKRLRRTT